MKSKILSLFSAVFLLFASVVYGNSSDYLESHQPYFVGELGPFWQFPSDHLPRGATIGNFHIAFWNILNKTYLGHIEENTQGLRYSSILKDDVPVNTGDTLTIRELTIGEMILEMRFIRFYRTPIQLMTLLAYEDDKAVA